MLGDARRSRRSLLGVAFALWRGEDAASCSKGLTYVKIGSFLVTEVDVGIFSGSNGVAFSYSFVPNTLNGDLLRQEGVTASAVD